MSPEQLYFQKEFYEKQLATPGRKNWEYCVWRDHLDSVNRDIAELQKKKAHWNDYMMANLKFPMFDPDTRTNIVAFRENGKWMRESYALFPAAYERYLCLSKKMRREFGVAMRIDMDDPDQVVAMLMEFYDENGINSEKALVKELRRQNPIRRIARIKQMDYRR